MYMISCYHKNGIEWYDLHTAAYWALRLKYFTTPFGEFLACFPEMLKFLTWAVLKWEFYGALLFVSPLYPSLMRLFACLGFMVLHVSFGLSLRLGFFTFITNVVLLALLPSQFWDFLEVSVWRSEIRRASTIFLVQNSSLATIVSHLLKNFLLTNHTLVDMIESKIESTQRDIESSSKGPEVGVWLKVTDPTRRQSLVNTRALIYCLRYLSPLTLLPGWYLSPPFFSRFCSALMQRPCLGYWPKCHQKWFSTLIVPFHSSTRLPWRLAALMRLLWYGQGSIREERSNRS